jgi:HD-GYP domain-containing protein (c-di-GMP phosphodiesterase class II)
MLKHVEFAGPVKPYITQHHERIDGSGYPLGLKGTDVLRGAQIIGMADMLDAMTRDRPYQSAQTMDQALQVLLVSSGVLFDADLVQACVGLFVQEGYRFPVG